MNTLHAISPADLISLRQKLLKFERSGQYEKALCEFGDSWCEPSFLPDTSELSEVESAEILLRFASLLGFYGHNLPLPDSQERTKNLLTVLLGRFTALGENEKAVECKNHIALAYWRNGEINEATVWIESALADIPPGISDTRLHAYVIRSLILLSQKRYVENTRRCDELAPMFFRHGDAFLTGSYCSNVGLSFKNTGKSEEALRYLELARDFHAISGHKVYLGTVENNLAQVYKEIGRFSKAHAAIDNAVRAFRRVKDKTREGFALDTKASVYLSEGENLLALAAIDAAARLLRKCDNAVYVAETLATKFKIQLRLDDLAGAAATLKQTVDLAQLRIGEEYANGIFEEFRLAANDRTERLERPAPQELPVVASGSLQLVLPRTLSHYDDFQGVWINNEHLGPAGLTKGSLAVIVGDSVGRGDLVAIVAGETGAVSCGYYDEDFGIVCLEGVGNEPQLFDSLEIRILGKIVGVCRGERDEQGKMIVEPISPRSA